MFPVTSESQELSIPAKGVDEHSHVDQQKRFPKYHADSMYQAAFFYLGLGGGGGWDSILRSPRTVRSPASAACPSQSAVRRCISLQVLGDAVPLASHLLIWRSSALIPPSRERQRPSGVPAAR